MEGFKALRKQSTIVISFCRVLQVHSSFDPLVTHDGSTESSLSNTTLIMTSHACESNRLFFNPMPSTPTSLEDVIVIIR